MNRSDHLDSLHVRTANPLLDYLDKVGFPWRLSSAQLKKRYGGWFFGLSRDPVLEIPSERPFMTGMKRPLATRVYTHFAPHIPVSEFFSYIYYQPDARTNAKIGSDELAAILGPGEQSAASNTVGRLWRFGASVCELTAWPPELQSDSRTHPLYRREPWRLSACNLTIRTGYLLSASASERAAIAGFREIVRWEPQTHVLPESSPWRTPAVPEFARQAEPDFAHCIGAIGTCSEGTNLVYFNEHLYLLPLDDIKHIGVERLRQAKGAAGSRLYLVARTFDCATAALTVCSAPGEDDLNNFAETLGSRLGKPVLLEPYEYNC